MPKSQIAWSCWNYLTFSNESGQSSETRSENRHEKEIKREQSLSADVNKVSLFVFLAFFIMFVLMNNEFIEHVRPT